MRITTSMIDKLVQPHGGDVASIAAQLGLEPTGLIDFSASLNPFGPPASVSTAIKGPPSIERYPEPDAQTLVRAIAERDGVSLRSILAGNGSAELLYWLCAWLKPEKVVIAEPGFADYRSAAAANGATIISLSLHEEGGFKLDFELLGKTAAGADMVILGRPNNPTGTMIDRDRLVDCIFARPRTKFLIDEAFIDFVDDEPSLVADVSRLKNLFVLRSMTKIYSMPGLRLGYLAGHESTVAPMMAARSPWPLSQTQIDAGRAALSDTDFQVQSRGRLSEERRFFRAELSLLKNIDVLDSAANFFLIKVLSPHLTSTALTISLAKAGFLVRDCVSFGLLGDRFIRLAVRARADNRKLVERLKEVLAGFDHDQSDGF